MEVLTASHSPTGDRRKRKRGVYDTSSSTDLAHAPPEQDAQRLRHSPSIALSPAPSTPSPHAGAPALDSPFVLPVHSDELGRLPIWPDLDAHAAASAGAAGPGTLWPALGDEAFVDTTGIYGVDHGPHGYDTELDSIFANLFPEYGADPTGMFVQGGGGLAGEQMQTGQYMSSYGQGSEAGVGSFTTASYPASSTSQSITGSSMFTGNQL